MFFTLASLGPAFRVPSLAQKRSPKGLLFGASVLIGLFEKVRRTNPFRHRTDSNLIHIPTGCVSNRRGLSHGLKNMPPACFLPSLRSGRPFESHLSHQKKAALTGGLFLVREMGLEPTRRSPHAPQTCLSTIPTLSQVLSYYNCCFLICQLLFHFLSDPKINRSFSSRVNALTSSSRFRASEWDAQPS